MSSDRIIEIRYSVRGSHGSPAPFGEWMTRAGLHRLTGSDLKFRGDVGEARFAAEESGGALAANPLPGALAWAAEDAAGDAARWRAEWREPMIGDAPSPMRVVHDVLPRVKESRLVLDDEGLHHAVVLRARDFRDELWPALRDEGVRWARETGETVRLEVDRFAPHEPRPPLPVSDMVRVFATAYMRGYFDRPPRTDVGEVAREAGVAAALAEACLARRGQAAAAPGERSTA